MTHNALLLRAAEEHITLGKVALEYVGFLSFFGVYGSLGFHFQVLKGLRAERSIDVRGSAVDRGERRAGAIGFIGALLMVLTFVAGVSDRAASKGISMMEVLSTGGGGQIFQIVCIAIFVISFALAAQRMQAAWIAAGVTATTAWRHLKHLNSLWTTPYGYALDAKLCVVAIVVLLGAWNWRRMKPRLGNEEAALAISRSATAELSFAAVVLAVTALLVSLPSPGPSGPPPAAGAPQAGGAPGGLKR